MVYSYRVCGRGFLPLLGRILCLSGVIGSVVWLFSRPGFAQRAPGVDTQPTPISTAERICETCHREIYRNYERTAMARASGPAENNLIPGDFTHAPSGVHYRVYQENGRAVLSFDRSGTDELHGTRNLLYYLGSGGRGRTYVFAVDGFYFESPINWYTQAGAWDMTPAYGNARHVPLNLPLNRNCLACHTTNEQMPVPGTENKYSEPLIAQQGIGCRRCHGEGDAHAASQASILNPAKFAPANRDAVCMQCHLEGNIAIRQPGRELNQFRPGDNLEEFVHYFIFSEARDRRAASQFEALFQSKCKRKSGDAMSCTSCHDPHFNPSPSEKAAYYRQRCLGCHGEAFAAKHHVKSPDCVSCHMPRLASSDIAHTQATDHRILRRQTSIPDPKEPLAEGRVPTLKRFPETSAPIGDRDLALAWAELAEKGTPGAAENAEHYLHKALAKTPDDSALLTAMGYLEERCGKGKAAALLLEQAVKDDPQNAVAETDLGVFAAQSGDMKQAIRLWKDAFGREPGSSAIGMNLSKALCAQGDAKAARDELARVLEFNPDLPEARRFLDGLRQNPAACALH